MTLDKKCGSKGHSSHPTLASNGAGTKWRTSKKHQHHPSNWRGGDAKSQQNDHPTSDNSEAATHSLLFSLRQWRDDSLRQNLYPTALFWAKKVLSITGALDDVYELAQIFYLSQDFPRAEKLLYSDPQILAASPRCRLLAAQCATELEKWSQVLEILSEDLSKVKSHNEGVCIQASALYFKGVAYSHLNKGVSAKKCFVDALQSDYRCFQAYQWLVDHHMLTMEEEDELIQSLHFDQMGSELGELSRFLYRGRSRQGSKGPGCENIKKKYHLYYDSDVLLAEAEQAFSRADYKESLKLSTSILDIDPYSIPCLILHIANLHQLTNKSQLFLLSHQLTEALPNEAISWYAVGTYYLTINKHHEARRYFTKSSTMDSLFGMAWIGFAHSFALESEHDQAITAYSTASRILQGSHCAFMFIGMQHLQVGNLSLADDFLSLAYSICKEDGLLLQEMGVLQYQLSKYDEAVGFFEKALSILSSAPKSHLVETIYLNMGHSQRRKCSFVEANNSYQKALYINPNNASALMSMGLISFHLGQYEAAISYYHEGLLLEPDNSIYIEMLDGCLSFNINLGSLMHESILSNEAVESKIDQVFGSYFDTKYTDSNFTKASPPKQIKTPHKDSNERSHGVKTRSQAKILSSDPFLGSSSHFGGTSILDFKSVLSNELLHNDNSPKTPPWKVGPDSVIPNRMKRNSIISNESSFVFTPMGASSKELLFASRAAEPEDHNSLAHGFNSECDEDDTFDDDVEMEEI